MPDSEKEMLNCYRQLPPEDRAAVLSHVRTAYLAENAVRKALAPAPPTDSNGGKGHKQGKTARERS